MSVLDICKMIISSPYVWIGATIVLSLIQISPLKLDPWTWIGMDDLIYKVDERIDKV